MLTAITLEGRHLGQDLSRKLWPVMYNGIDRVDSEKGYVVGNCVPCCYEVNRAKSNMTQSDFLELVRQISVNLKLEVGSNV